MEFLNVDEIDFAVYENETDAQQKVKGARVWIRELIDRITNPVVDRHVLLPWRKTHNLIGFRPGEVTIWGGANGHGKSLVTGQVALSLCAQGERVCMASFEMKPMKTLERMGRQFSGENPEHPAYTEAVAKQSLVDMYTDFMEWTDNRMWLYDQQGTVSAKQVAAVARYCAKELGITHFFIDSLMKCVAGEDDHNGQKGFVDELCSIARDHSIHVHLIHHIRKPRDESVKPTKYDYKGSGAITDQVDNVITVWRNKEKEKRIEAQGRATDADKAEHDQLLICDKQRNGDWEGTIGLWFDRHSQQFMGNFGDEPQMMNNDPRDFQ